MGRICALTLAVIGGLFVYLSLEAEGGLSLTQVNGRNGSTTVTKKIAVVAVLCAVVALVACRREEYRPLKLGGPVAEQPAR